MEKHLKYKEEEMSIGMDAVFDIQAGHSSRTAGLAYAIADRDHRSVSREGMHRFYMASKDWYDLLLSSGQSQWLKGMLFLAGNPLIV